MKKHYETYVEDTDKLISVAGPVLDYKSWYEQYRKLMEEQAQRKYGLYTPTSEGDDDFPSISGMIARYSALGLTNEQMAENPVWKDLTGNGHDLQMKNFAWGGMSGVNGYKFDFLLNEWVTSNEQISEKYSYKIVINNKQNSVQLINNSRHIKITLKITGIEINKSIFRVYDNAGKEHKQDYTKDGIYEIDYTANEGANKIYFYVVGGNIGQLENPITIEQLPLYPGALVFDGVDDYGTCDNFPILTKEKGYTVVALRQWIEEKNSVTALASNSKNWNQDGAFVFEYNNLENNYPNIEISFGSNNMFDRGLSPYSYQTSKSYNGNLIESGSFLGSDKLVVAKANENLSPNSNIAIWELVFLDHDATEEELTKIKDYFVKTYPWLFPDQAWTVTGKTNEDEDRATIANITGNGNDLVLSNFGFIEGSGYNEEGEYAGYLVTNGVDDKITSSAFKMGKDWTVVGDWKFINDESKNAGIIKPSSLYVYNALNGVSIFINSGSIGNNIKENKGFNAICSNGRAYDRNWTEYSELKVEEVTKSNSELKIGASSNDTTYTRMAFKNFAIYPKVLSKDDCIKAYNYLQTLKAK